jgi:hypothetical protein
LNLLRLIRQVTDKSNQVEDGFENIAVSAAVETAARERDFRAGTRSGDIFALRHGAIAGNSISGAFIVTNRCQSPSGL